MDFNNTFYFNQYLQILFELINHVKLKAIFTILGYEVFEICVCIYTDSKSYCGPASFRACDQHMWLVAVILSKVMKPS